MFKKELSKEDINKLKETIRTKLREKKIEEETTTASVDGYNTPFAFGKDTKGDIKRKVKSSGAGFEFAKSIDEKKYPSFADPLEGFPTEYKELLKKLQRSNDSDERTQLINKMNVIRKNIKLKPLTNEAINENRWLDLKRDETRTPSQKVSHGIREVKNQLAEIERFVNWYNRLRSENNLGKNDFFKRTNTNIYRIKERIIKIASSIQEIDKAESDTNIEEVEGKKPMALDKFVVTATAKGANKDAERRTITKPAPKNSAQSQLKSLTKMDKYQSVRLKKA